MVVCPLLHQSKICHRVIHQTHPSLCICTSNLVCVNVLLYIQLRKMPSIEVEVVRDGWFSFFFTLRSSKSYETAAGLCLLRNWLYRTALYNLKATLSLTAFSLSLLGSNKVIFRCWYVIASVLCLLLCGGFKHWHVGFYVRTIIAVGFSILYVRSSLLLTNEDVHRPC